MHCYQSSRRGLSHRGAAAGLKLRCGQPETILELSKAVCGRCCTPPVPHVRHIAALPRFHGWDLVMGPCVPCTFAWLDSRPEMKPIMLNFLAPSFSSFEATALCSRTCSRRTVAPRSWCIGQTRGQCCTLQEKTGSSCRAWLRACSGLSSKIYECDAAISISVRPGRP